jgi:extracellular factor (EF) 3-hydroxypalmitic acid methyl ester biosynthesis protein
MTNKPLVHINKSEEKATAFLEYLVNNGGPELDDYERFTSIVNNLHQHEVDNFREIIKPALNANTLIGHGFVKPFGYPGDFTLIDKIYRYDRGQKI